jgi:hypothetical protein
MLRRAMGRGFDARSARPEHATHDVRVAAREKFARTATEVWGTHVEALPNLCDLSEPMAPVRSGWSGDALRVGVFDAARVLKNGLTAAAAAAELAARLRVADRHPRFYRRELVSLRRGASCAGDRARPGQLTQRLHTSQ